MNHKLRLLSVFVFELLAIFIITPLFSLIFRRPMASIGIVAIATSLIAMLINYVFNLYFDKLISHRIKRKLLVRTILFQIVMLSFFIPFVMVVLKFSFDQSLIYNTSGSLFFMTYFYIYNYIFENVVRYFKYQYNH